MGLRNYISGMMKGACKTKKRTRATETLGSPCKTQVCSATAPVIEALESRLLFTAFNCYMSAQATGSHTSNYEVIVSSTGQKASSYVIHWNDPNPGGTMSTSYTAPTSGAPLSESYQYKGAYNGTITAVATSTTSATATAYFALSSNFGNFQGASDSGATTYGPYGTKGSVGQTSMVIDNVGTSSDPMLGATFVAHTFYLTTGGNPVIGISAFDSTGAPINNWGSIGTAANPGTFVVPSFGGRSDKPYAMTIALVGGTDTYLFVAGKCATGWAICAVDTSANSSVIQPNYSYKQWTTVSSFESGQANAIMLDSDGDHIVAAGTDGTHIVAAALDFDGTPFTNWGTTGIVTEALSGDELSAGANAVIDEQATSGPDEVLVGGHANFCCGACGGCGGTGPSGSDYTLVAIDDSDGSFGTPIRTNIGATLAANSGCTSCNPSSDSVYSMVPYYDGTTLKVDAVGQSNAQTGGTITIAQYAIDGTSGAPTGLVSGFGQYSGCGIATGPTGSAFAAVAVGTAGKFIVTGGTGAGDFITCQFTALGAADTTFGNAGVMYQDLGSTSANSNDIGYALLYDPTANSVLICGATTPGGSSTSILGLVEYQDSNKVSIS
ncbi:MAG TPA: hypothetical protein VFC78_24980 [Tepidisphaeraceae bacterium]|nr:hypothetical protein [Tepidisphaeraceae bacterium]